MQNYSKKTLWAEIKEIWQLFIHFRFKALLITPTENGLLLFGRYGIIAVVATVVDFLGLYIGTECGLHYLISTAISYAVGIFVTYILSKLTVFNASQTRVSTGVEISVHFVIGLIAIGMTELLMWLCTDMMHIYYMVSRAIALVLVFFWNCFARKWAYRHILYK